MEKQIAMAYVRVSTDEQTEYSPSAQLSDIMDYAAKNNIFIPKDFIFIDEGISGKTAEKRPAFQKMIKLARKKTNNVSLIIVHKFDRFSRKKDDQVLYKALLKKDGVKVISVKEPIPEDDKFAVIYESMLEAMAEYYSLNLAEEVKKTMVKKAENGEYQSVAPFGYKNENKTLAIVPEEAKTVRLIFEKYLEGMPMLQIADMVNTMGFRTHRGNVFENRTIQYILNNPVYCGYVRWTPSGRIRRDFYNKNSLVSKGTHPAIIDEDTFKKASEKWKSKRSITPSHQRPITEGKHWLSGLVKCSSCGRSLVISHINKNGSFSMQCGGYNHGQCKVSHSVSSNILIPAFLDELKSIAETKHIDSSIIFTRPSATDEDNINRLMLNKARIRLAKAKAAYLDGIDTLEEYKITKTQTEAEIKNLEEKIKQKQAAPKNPLSRNSYIKKLTELYTLLSNDNVDMNIKKTSIREIVEKIIYNKKDNTFMLYLLDV